MIESFDFVSAWSRRLPDPNFKNEHQMETHIFVVRCKDMPAGIGTEPNARQPNLHKRTYQNVKSSLLGEDDTEQGTFHLKNKGITIIADKVSQIDGKDSYRIDLESGSHGIVDGGHTYKLIVENRDDIPEDQFVKVEIRTGVPQAWIPMISGGLNTAVQVQAMSLDNLSGKFVWLKTLLGSQKDNIAWSENDENTFLDARDLTAIMCLFNVALFPNESGKQPTEAYTSKARTLGYYEQDQAKFEQMNDIVKDILTLHDTVAFTAKDHLKTAGIKQTGKLAIVDMKKKGKHTFPFIGQQAEQRLQKPALYPILGAFRRFVVRDNLDGGKMKWVVDFDLILEFWQQNGPQMLQIVYDTSVDLRYNLNAVGKSANLWTTLHSFVGMKTYELGYVRPA